MSTTLDASTKPEADAQNPQPSTGTTDAERGEIEDADLPPMDSGWAAYLFLFANCFIQGIIWGFPFCYGAFQKFYQERPAFANASGITNIGTISTGFMYLLTPIVLVLLNSFPKYQRAIPVAGLALCISSLIGASFSTTIKDLTWTQGVLYGIGGSLVSSANIALIPQWFHKNAGIAWGCTWGATGVSSFILPLVLDISLRKYGYPTVHRGCALALFILCTPLIYFCRPRLPTPPTPPLRWPYLSFTTTPYFYFLFTGNVIQGFGYFIPFIFIPARTSLFPNISSTKASLTLSLSNAASIAGQVIQGHLGDSRRFNLDITTIWIYSALTSGIFTLTLWGLADGYGMAIAFSIMYGLTAGGFSSAWANCGKRLKDVKGKTDVALVNGLFMMGRGIGNCIAGPLSERLVAGEKWEGRGTYGTVYGKLVVMTGVTAIAAAGFGAAARWWMEKREAAKGGSSVGIAGEQGVSEGEESKEDRG